MSRFNELLEKFCPEGVKFATLEESGYLYSGLRGKSKPDFSMGNAPYVSYLDIANHPSLPQEVSSRVKVHASEDQNMIQLGDLLFTGSSEDSAGVGLTSEVEYSPPIATYLNSFCFGFRSHPGLFARGYLKHLFRSNALRQLVISSSNGVTRINVSKKSLVKISIPVPPLEVQSEIVSILDRLTLLETELETELEARRKQYEHYRNKLLTFKELETA